MVYNKTNLKDYGHDEKKPNLDTNYLKRPISYTDKKAFSVELKRHRILRFLRKNPFSTIYKIHKSLNMSYASTHQAMKELCFARLICVKQGFDSNEMPCELFFIPRIKGEPQPLKNTADASLEDKND